MIAGLCTGFESECDSASSLSMHDTGPATKISQFVPTDLIPGETGEMVGGVMGSVDQLAAGDIAGGLNSEYWHR